MYALKMLRHFPGHGKSHTGLQAVVSFRVCVQQETSQYRILHRGVTLYLLQSQDGCKRNVACAQQHCL